MRCRFVLGSLNLDFRSRFPSFRWSDLFVLSSFESGTLVGFISSSLRLFVKERINKSITLSKYTDLRSNCQVPSLQFSVEQRPVFGYILLIIIS
jgi:hypothetical protein